MSKCVAWVEQSAYMVGKLPKIRCNKEAIHVDIHGRELCNKHYNRWLKKIAKNPPI